MARPTLRDEEVERFRQRLCDLALRRVAESGYEGVTLRGLARDLGCSYATPYRYFRDKEEIFAAVRALAYERFGAALEHAAGPGCRIGLLLEGGYNLAALARSVTATVGVLGEPIAPVDIGGSASPAALGLGQFIKKEHPFFKDMD